MTATDNRQKLGREVLQPRRDQSDDTIRDIPSGGNIDWSLATAKLNAHKRVLALGALTGFLLGVIILHLMVPRYTITMQVTPVEQNSLSRLSGSLGALSSLSSLSNLALPASPSQTQLELYLAAVQSVPVATDLVNQPYIAHGVFWRDWDDEKRVWERPSEIKSLIVNAGKAVLDMPIRDWHPPDGPQMAKALSEFVTVDYQRTSPIVTITYKDRDPQFGVSLLLALHKAADSRLRTRVVQRTATYIDYLQQQLRVVTSAEQRTALINALTNQEELRMAAMANVSYSVDVLVPPTPSIRPTDPNPYVYVVLFTLLGAIAGAGYILYRK